MFRNKSSQLMLNYGYCFFVVLLLGVLFIPACRSNKTDWCLIIEDPRCETVFYSLPIDPGDILSLSYRHSVSRSIVEGTFILTSTGKIEPETTSYTAYGPGLPVERYVDWKIKDGVITVYHEEEPRDSIRLWVTDLTEETIHLHDKSYPLFTLSGTNLLLEIYLADENTCDGSG